MKRASLGDQKTWFDRFFLLPIGFLGTEYFLTSQIVRKSSAENPSDLRLRQGRLSYHPFQLLASSEIGEDHDLLCKKKKTKNLPCLPVRLSPFIPFIPFIPFLPFVPFMRPIAAMAIASASGRLSPSRLAFSLCRFALPPRSRCLSTAAVICLAEYGA